MACALFGFMACTQETIDEQSAIRVDAPETIKVGFEDDETRIQLNSAQKTVWTKEDLVSVFYRSDANQKWQYQGETGERVGNLKRVEDATATTQTTKTVVVYPYSKNYWLNTDNYAIDATLPATQYYAAGSYGVGSNLMVSQSEFTQFSLKSVCGWLKLQLTGNGEVVKSIKFRGNNGEQVAGLIYVDTATAEATLASEMGGSDDNNAGGNLVFDDTIITEVVLDCGEGVTLGAEATPFYISLPPQTFANGFTVEIECEDYELMTLTTEKELVIERNHIQPMASVEHNAEQIIPNNEIWYTNGSTTEATTLYSTTAFGANIVSNTYDAAKECWVIKFDGKVTTIGDEAFRYCRSLTSVTIPDSVTTIGHYAFYGCSSLTSVTIGNGVTRSGEGAFYDCGSLTSVYISDIVAWCNISYSDPRSNPLSYGCNLYLNNELVTDLTIPDSVTTIGERAFEVCSSLTRVTIPDSVTTIGAWAFDGCRSLTSVTIPDSVTTIGIYAFQGCSSLQEFNGKFASEDGRCLIIDGTLNSFAPAGLTEYTIPDSVTTIGYAAFSNIRSLKTLTVPDNVTDIEQYAFGGFSGELVINCNIPSASSSLYGAFNGSKFTSVTIGDGVTRIGDYAFYGCRSLTSVTIPDSVTTIEGWAFQGCRSLTSITIPDSVTTIGICAFYDCRSLTSVYCKAAIPPAGGSSMFSYYDYENGGYNIGCTIYVPMESVEAYKSASGWSNYASDIVGYNF